MTVDETPSWLQAKIDDAAVDRIAGSMKSKLLRKNIDFGKRDWHSMPVETLLDQFWDHILKGDVVDVANYCAMLHARAVDKNRVAFFITKKHTGAKK